MSESFDIEKIRGTVSKNSLQKIQQAYVKDADLEVFVPGTQESLGLEENHTLIKLKEEQNYYNNLDRDMSDDEIKIYNK